MPIIIMEQRSQYDRLSMAASLCRLYQIERDCAESQSVLCPNWFHDSSQVVPDESNKSAIRLHKLTRKQTINFDIYHARAVHRRRSYPGSQEVRRPRTNVRLLSG